LGIKLCTQKEDRLEVRSKDKIATRQQNVYTIECAYLMEKERKRGLCMRRMLRMHWKFVLTGRITQNTRKTEK
jgi:hypothetical protein